MTSETTRKQDQKKARVKIGGVGLGEYTTATILGAASGAAGFVGTIRKRFSDDINNSADMKKAIESQAERLSGKITKVHESGKATKLDIKLPLGDFSMLAGKPTSVANSRELADEIASIVRTEKEIFREDKELWLLHRMGVRPGFIESTFDMLKHMHKKSGTIRAIVMNSIVSTIIGAAATIGFFNGFVTRDKIEAIDSAVEPDLKQPPDMKTKPYKDRDPLPEPETPSSKTAKAIKASREILDNHEKPASHVDKLVTESSEHKDVQVAAR